MDASSYISRVNAAIDSMASDANTLESLSLLAQELQAASKTEVLAITEALGVRCGASKTARIARLQCKLRDLKATLSKQRMYG